MLVIALVKKWEAVFLLSQMPEKMIKGRKCNRGNISDKMVAILETGGGWQKHGEAEASADRGTLSVICRSSSLVICNHLYSFVTFYVLPLINVSAMWYLHYIVTLSVLRWWRRLPCPQVQYWVPRNIFNFCSQPLLWLCRWHRLLYRWWNMTNIMRMMMTVMLDTGFQESYSTLDLNLWAAGGARR